MRLSSSSAPFLLMTTAPSLWIIIHHLTIFHRALLLILRFPFVHGVTEGTPRGCSTFPA